MRPTVLLVLSLVALLELPAQAGIQSTKHNLSVSATGTVKADQESRLCIFCHTPHHASVTQGILWNREDSTVTYIPYDSPTLTAIVGQPTGASKLCLSCHDGTVALGALLSEPAEVGFVGGVRFMPVGPGLIGSDLSDDHPVSFDYDAGLAANNLDLVDPVSLTGDVKLDAFRQLQCTSCHDPHEAGFGKFLVASSVSSELCRTCHDQSGWTTSVHATSLATWNGVLPDPWPESDLTTVVDNACANCHRPHAAKSTAWILKHEFEEDNCLVCHNGQVAATDIEAEITTPFNHPVEAAADVHEPSEDASLPLTFHVECTDCHDPHTVTDTIAAAPFASGALRGATGIDSAGQPVADVTFEYEVCFKCHSQFSMTNPPVNRQLPQVDKRLQFELQGASFHPVVALGQNNDVPSLLPPYTEASYIYCSDCHASDAGPGAGGSSPAGPHGSMYDHLLERRYNLLDGIAYTPVLYDMCLKCHSETSLLNDESFAEHRKHIEGEDAPCSVCHDPHGVSSTQGNAVNNAHLINFDISVVSPDPQTGRLEFEDLGNKSGRCYLSCHGEDHSLLDDHVVLVPVAKVLVEYDDAADEDHIADVYRCGCRNRQIVFGVCSVRAVT